ncbi:hypothetical protein ACFYW8_42865 [Streptomyces sp. NPDC002742]|uniref:hypothetical protein n=1 Tax=Streptomyces sp. NPDC002742 TaxID=3364663 RepID=UPI00368A34A5
MFLKPTPDFSLAKFEDFTEKTHPEVGVGVASSPPPRRTTRRYAWAPQRAQATGSGYVTNCCKELVENTVDIERGVNIVVKDGKYVTSTGKKLFLVMKDTTRNSASVLRGQQVRDVDQGWLCSHPHDSQTS